MIFLRCTTIYLHQLLDPYTLLTYTQKYFSTHKSFNNSQIIFLHTNHHECKRAAQKNGTQKKYI